MSVIRRLYDLSPAARAAIGFGGALATFGLIAADAFWFVALLPFVVGGAIANRLVPGGRLNLVPRVDPDAVLRQRRPFSVLAGAVAAVGLISTAITDSPRWMVAGAAVSVAISCAADAVAPTRPAASRS